VNIAIGRLFNKSLWEAIDWIFPPECAGCGEPGYRLCPDCQGKIPFRNGPRCRFCGDKVGQHNDICSHCSLNEHPHRALRCFADYSGVVRECIQAIKYEKNLGLGELFSEWLASIVVEEGWNIDMVMPVPLSPERMAERGYNQSTTIAKPLARLLGLPFNPYGLKRIRNTPSQVGLSAAERHLNVAGAFKALPEIVIGKNILVIDDVMTTGSTLEACAEALKQAKSADVYCLTIAGSQNKVMYQN
jgi:ComF family protein